MLTFFILAFIAVLAFFVFRDIAKTSKSRRRVFVMESPASLVQGTPGQWHDITFTPCGGVGLRAGGRLDPSFPKSLDGGYPAVKHNMRMLDL